MLDEILGTDNQRRSSRSSNSVIYLYDKDPVMDGNIIDEYPIQDDMIENRCPYTAPRGTGCKIL